MLSELLGGAMALAQVPLAPSFTVHVSRYSEVRAGSVSDYTAPLTDLEHTVFPGLLLLQNLQRLICIAWGDDTVRNLQSHTHTQGHTLTLASAMRTLSHNFLYMYAIYRVTIQNKNKNAYILPQNVTRHYKVERIRRRKDARISCM